MKSFSTFLYRYFDLPIDQHQRDHSSSVLSGLAWQHSSKLISMNSLGSIVQWFGTNHASSLYGLEAYSNSPWVRLFRDATRMPAYKYPSSIQLGTFAVHIVGAWTSWAIRILPVCLDLELADFHCGDFEDDDSCRDVKLRYFKLCSYEMLSHPLRHVWGHGLAGSQELGSRRSTESFKACSLNSSEC